MMIMKKSFIKYLLLTGAAAVFGCTADHGETGNMSGTDDLTVVTTIADRLCTAADLKFIDKNTGREYASAWDAPEDANLKFKNKYCNWHYTNGVLNMAMMDLADFTGDRKYLEFAGRHIAFGFDNYRYFEKRYDPAVHGDHWRYPLGELFNVKELDDFGAMISSTLDYCGHDDAVKRPEYVDYAIMVGEYLRNGKLRMPDGTFVRSFPEKNTLWGDDLYMSVPLLVRLANLTGDASYRDDALNQIRNFDGYLWDEGKKLYHHAYYTDLKRNSVAHWARCNGWMMFAKVEFLDNTPEDCPGRQEVIDLLDKQICGLSSYQSPYGVWHQLLDRSDSYPESSASAIYTYCIARSVNEGWIDDRYASIALTGWEGIKREFLTSEGDMKAICEGTEVYEDLQYYYNRPCGTNEKHGLGALLEAGIEIIRLKDKCPDIAADIEKRIDKNDELGFNK